MLDETLQALTTAAGNALVSAMATDAWAQVRSRTAQALQRFRRKRRDEIEAALDRDAAMVVSAADRELTRQDLRRLWQARLAELLAEDAGFGLELGALVAAIGTAPPSGPGTHVQHNAPRAGGIVYAVQDGTQVIRDTRNGNSS
jgi:Flp pilus assembly protein TadB